MRSSIKGNSKPPRGSAMRTAGLHSAKRRLSVSFDPRIDKARKIDSQKRVSTKRVKKHQSSDEEDEEENNENENENENEDEDDNEEIEEDAEAATQQEGAASEGEEETDSEESEEDEESTDKIDSSASRAHGPGSAKRSVKITAEDIQIARETAELFKSNIFKLQIDELISELRLKESNVKLIEKVLHKLHEIIQEIPERPAVSLTDAEKQFATSKVSIPFPDPKPSKVQYSFAYVKPVDVRLVGSFGLKTGIKQPKGMTIDVALSMPEELFRPKDYLNYRAFHKRAYYLAVLTEGIIKGCKQHGIEITVKYDYVNGDTLRPALLVSPVQSEKKSELNFYKTKFSIRFIPSFPFAFFESTKLLPDKNCIRIQHGEPTGESPAPPTPLYNSAIISDSAYTHYLTYLYMVKKSCAAFRDACVLGRLWLLQRGFNSSLQLGGFGHFEWSVLLAALLQGGGSSGNKILLSGYSSYQLFKGAIKYLASQDLSNGGYLQLNSESGSHHSKFHSTSFGVPTMFDKYTKLNLLWKMTPWSYKQLQQEAQRTLALLNDVVRDRFDSIFLKKVYIPQIQSDITFSFPVPDMESDAKFTAVERIFYITYENYFMNKVHVLLQRGLEARVKNISLRGPLPESFSVSRRKSPTLAKKSTVTVSLTLDAQECEKLVTHGPLAEETAESEKFQQFWGKLSELRRFKDGTIKESVVWKSSPTKPIVVSIVEYLLNRHIEENISTKMQFSHVGFAELLPVPKLAGASAQSITSVALYQKKRSAFEELTKVIQELDGIPLQVKTIVGTSADLRYTSVYEPVPFLVEDPYFFGEAVLEFESSMRWPDDLVSTERTKTAFLIKIAEQLEQTDYRCSIGTYEKIPYVNSINYLEVLTPEGFGFRITATCERDALFYERLVQNMKERNSETKQHVARTCKAAFEKRYSAAVKHTRTLQTLTHAFPFYPATARLLKQWLDSHFLLEFFDEELVELFALKPFVDPAPWSVPTSVHTGFLRCLEFLATWNWKEQPLILDLNKHAYENDEEKELIESMFPKTDDGSVSNLTIQVYQTLMNKFETLRKEDPGCHSVVYYVASKDEPTGVLWTKNDHKLTPVVATRLTALARAAMGMVMTIKETQLSSEQIQMLFTPSLKDFDFSMSMKSQTFKAKALQPPEEGGYRNLNLSPTEFPADILGRHLDYTGEFYREISERYEGAALFFRRKYPHVHGGKVSGDWVNGLWIPSALGTGKFRVNLGYSSKPVESSEGTKSKGNNKKTEGALVALNKEAILEEITLLGGDLVKSVKPSR